MSQNNGNTLSGRNSKDQERSDDDTPMEHIPPPHDDDEVTINLGYHDSGRDTVKQDSPIHEHPSAPDSSGRQSASNRQDLLRPCSVTEDTPPRPRPETVGEGLLRAADSLEIQAGLLRAAAELLGPVLSPQAGPGTLRKSTAKRHPSDNSQEHTQQSLPQVFAGLPHSPPRPPTAHRTSAIFRSTLLPPVRLDNASEHFDRVALDGLYGPDIKRLA